MRQITLRQLWSSARTWLTGNMPRVLLMSSISFAVSWVLNVWIIAFRYDGFNKGTPGRAVASSDGNLYTGGLFWGVLSMVVVSFVTYGFATGWRQTIRDMAALPSHILRLARDSGGTAWSLVLWAAATMLLIATVMSEAIAPAVAGVAGLGFLLAAPSAVSGIVGRLIGRFWAAAMARLSPSNHPPIPGLGGSLVGMVGSALGLLVASQMTGTGAKLAVGAVFAIVSYLIVSGGISISKPAVLAIVAAATMAWVWARAGVALADDGGWQEFQDQIGGGFWDWLRWEPTLRILRLSLGGAFGGFIGSLAGASIGSVLASLQTIPGSWQWLPSADEVVPPSDEIGDPGMDLSDARPIDEVAAGLDDQSVAEPDSDGSDAGAGDDPDGSGSGPAPEGADGGDPAEAPTGTPGSDEPATVTPGISGDVPSTPRTITLEGDDARRALDAWRRAGPDQRADIPIPEDQQWDMHVSDDSGTIARSGHSGTRGEITSINIVAEGDGDLVINIDVDTYVPEGEAPPPPIDPGQAPSAADAATDGGEATQPADASTTDAAAGSETAPAPDEQPPGPETVGDDPTGDEPVGPTGTDGSTASQGNQGDQAEHESEAATDESSPEAPGDAGASGHDEDPSDPGDSGTEADAAGDDEDGADLESGEEADAPDDDAPGSPDGSDPGELATWAEGTIGGSGLLGNDDTQAIGDLIRGDDDAITLSGDFGGRFGGLLTGHVTDRSDGIAVELPTGDTMVLRVRDGEIELRHEASLISIFASEMSDAAEGLGLDIPNIEDLVESARGPLDAFNQSLGVTGRRVVGIDANPNGTITIRTDHRG